MFFNIFVLIFTEQKPRRACDWGGEGSGAAQTAPSQALMMRRTVRQPIPASARMIPYLFSAVLFAELLEFFLEIYQIFGGLVLGCIEADLCK